MKQSEMLEKLNGIEELKGLEIWADKRRPVIEVSGFNRTADWKATKAILESLGFDCGPNSGRIICDEAKPAVTKRQVPTREMTREFIRMGGWADYVACDCGGQQSMDADGHLDACNKCGSTRQLWD